MMAASSHSIERLAIPNIFDNERIHSLMSQSMSCQCCNKPYEGAGGKDARQAVIFPCICRLCKGCASEEEAKVQQQQQQKEQPKKKGKGKGKGKAKKEEEEKTYTPTPCINCAKLCDTPVAELLLDTVMMRKVDAGGGAC